MYVCTTADRSYALEAWRHLDPSALLIPYADRRKRFHNVHQDKDSKDKDGNVKPVKDLAHVMGLLGHPWSAPCTPPNSAMPLAVIIDDQPAVRILPIFVGHATCLTNSCM